MSTAGLRKITGSNKSDYIAPAGALGGTEIDAGNGNDTVVGTGFGDIILGGNGKDWLAGSYSFADSALFYVSFWWNGRMGKDLPANVAAHFARMKARPAVQRVMAAEGLA